MNLDQKVDELKDKLVKSTQEIVSIESTLGESKEGMPYGEGPYKALEKALSISSKLGFKTVNMDGHIGYAEYGDQDDYVAVLGHVDVVPAGSGWLHEPYGAEIADGKIYGRGTTDDKGPIISALYGLKAIKDANLPLSKRVRIIFGTNEECGCKDAEYYMQHEKAPVSGFTPDAEYPVIFGEKGIVFADFVSDVESRNSLVKSIVGGNRPNMVPDRCKAVLNTKDEIGMKKALTVFKERHNFDIEVSTEDGNVVLNSIGMSAHGSIPEKGKNAIMQLFAFLGTLPLNDEKLEQYIRFMNKNVGFEFNGESLGIGLHDEPSGKLSLNVGVIKMDDNKISTTFDMRYPVTYKLDDVLNILEKKLKDTRIKLENIQNQNPLYFPKDSELVKKLMNIYKEETGDERGPLAIGGGTYAKDMPNIVAFGPIFPGKPDLDHQANEYIEIEDLVLNAKIYARAIYELAK